MSASRWQRGCIVLSTACLIVAIVACPLGVVGVWRGILSPPWFDQTLGTRRVIGYHTWNASCPPYVGCAPTRRESYVIWLVVDQSGPAGQSKGAYRFLSLEIDHAP
jgi:hypothetical protein